MNIWEMSVNKDFNSAFLVNESGKQCFDRDPCYIGIQGSSLTRELKIEVANKGFPDIMNYWGTSGTYVVNSKVRELIETYYGGLKIQFLPCRCDRSPDMELWLLNVCEYHDVLDIPNCTYLTRHDPEGKEIIISIDKYAFKKDAFEFDMFKIILNDRRNSLRLFVSDRFKAIMEEHEVTGLELEKMYSI